MKFHFLSSNNSEAKKTEKKLTELFGQNSVEDADYIIPIGGDGLLLKSLHNFNKLNKPFFGINFGSIGFLMNNLSNENLSDMICLLYTSPSPRDLVLSRMPSSA